MRVSVDFRVLDNWRTFRFYSNFQSRRNILSLNCEIEIEVDEVPVVQRISPNAATSVSLASRMQKIIIFLFAWKKKNYSRLLKRISRRARRSALKNDR